MTQEEFDSKMEQNLKVPTVRSGIEESMLLAHEYPLLAMSWAERLLSKSKLNENRERFVDADSIEGQLIEGQLIVLRKSASNIFSSLFR